MHTNIMKSKIKWNLTKVSPKEIAEINDFVESILRKKKENRKIVPLKGVWKGLGFEKNPNLEEDWTLDKSCPHK